MERILFRIGPPNIYRVFILSMLLVWVMPLQSIIVFPWAFVGLPFLFFGMYIALRAKRLFKDSDTPILPAAVPTKLHQGGLYKFTRNPMYLGIALALLGTALLTGKLINAVFPLLFCVIIDRFFIEHEEAALEKEFGEQFLSYKRKTPRWI